MADGPYSLSVYNSTVHVLKVIKGLSSEREDVKRRFYECKPDAVALSISKEELAGLRALIEGSEHSVALSPYEEVYARRLAAFGEVRVPPPAYEEAMLLAIQQGIPTHAIDMDEEAYTSAFCSHISGLALFWHSLCFRRIKKKRFKAHSPEEFVEMWDRYINRLKGFRNLERAREEHMAKELIKFSGHYNSILAVIEWERGKGVMEHVQQLKDRNLPIHNELGKV